MSNHQRSILEKLAAAWGNAPEARFGQLIEAVEDVGWDMCSQRQCAPRLLWMPDALFEGALDKWNRISECRKLSTV